MYLLYIANVRMKIKKISKSYIWVTPDNRLIPCTEKKGKERAAPLFWKGPSFCHCFWTSVSSFFSLAMQTCAGSTTVSFQAFSLRLDLLPGSLLLCAFHLPGPSNSWILQLASTDASADSSPQMATVSSPIPGPVRLPNKFSSRSIHFY